MEHSEIRTVEVQVFEEFEEFVSEHALAAVAERTLASEAVGTSEGVSIVIADDATVRDLNGRYRGLDENTDVLSFAFGHQGEYYGQAGPVWEVPGDAGFVTPPEAGSGLGEVIISYPQMARQAQESGHSLEQEMAHLVAHGLLHLLGYDHMEAEDEAVMKAKESNVLAQVLRDE